VRAVVADVLDEPASTIGDQDDLLELGLDSVRLMTITEQFRERGSEVALVDLVENPTIAAWTRLLSGSVPPGDGAGTTAAAR
jgi:bifunctional isochorismate lyase/aryl carrier protein